MSVFGRVTRLAEVCDIEGCAGWAGALPQAYRRRVMEEVTTFVGLDVHKATIAVAVAVGGLREAAEFLGTIENTPQALAKLLAKLRRKHKHLSFATKPGHAAMACTGN